MAGFDTTFVIMVEDIAYKMVKEQMQPCVWYVTLSGILIF